MDEQLKQRLVGATVLVLLAVIFVPMLLDDSPGPARSLPPPSIPPKPPEVFTSKVVPFETQAPAEPPAAVAPPPAPAPEPVDAPASGKPGPGPKPAPAAAPPKTPPAGRPDVTAWAVQLGSFTDRDNAVGLRDRLRKKGYTAFVESGRSDRGTVTRVYVGPALERDAALVLRDRLEGEVKLKGIVIRYPGG